MKPFEYYDDVEAKVGKKYPKTDRMEKRLMSELMEKDLPLTEHMKQLEVNHRKVADWYQEQYKPFVGVEEELEIEFWKDCRVELGYGKRLDEVGCELLEDLAGTTQELKEGVREYYPDFPNSRQCLFETLREVVTTVLAILPHVKNP